MLMLVALLAMWAAAAYRIGVRLTPTRNAPN